MIALHVFDPAMCCSTGVCGPSVDPELARFAADLDWLASHGVAVERFNLAQQPAQFASDEAVKSALTTLGDSALPVIKVNGEVKCTGTYPSRLQLAAWTGLRAVAVAEAAAPNPPSTSGCCCGPSTSPDPTKKSGCC